MILRQQASIDAQVIPPPRALLGEKNHFKIKWSWFLVGNYCPKKKKEITFAAKTYPTLCSGDLDAELDFPSCEISFCSRAGQLQRFCLCRTVGSSFSHTQDCFFSAKWDNACNYSTCYFTASAWLRKGKKKMESSSISYSCLTTVAAAEGGMRKHLVDQYMSNIAT